MKVTMKFYFLSLLAASLLQAADEASKPVNIKVQLATNVASCNASAFEKNWTEYQKTAQTGQVADMQTQLGQLAMELKTIKEHERTQKLGNTWKRGVAGLRGVITAYPLFFLGAGIFVELKKAYDERWWEVVRTETLQGGGTCTTTFFIPELCFKRLFKANSIQVLISGLLIHYTAQQIQYARFAGTEQLTTELTALDTIIALLTPEQTQITQI